LDQRKNPKTSAKTETGGLPAAIMSKGIVAEKVGTILLIAAVFFLVAERPADWLLNKHIDDTLSERAIFAATLLISGSPDRLSASCVEPGLSVARAGDKKDFGNQNRVEVGGTQIERDDAGRVSMRIRDIVVRDGNGKVLASVPNAEVMIRSCTR
jgi:hypothetical protein